MDLDRTSNRDTLVQGVAGSTPEVDGDGALGGRLPGEVDGLAGLGVETCGGNVERVRTVWGLSALSISKQRCGSDSQEGGWETHVDGECCSKVERRLMILICDELESKKTETLGMLEIERESESIRMKGPKKAGYQPRRAKEGIKADRSQPKATLHSCLYSPVGRGGKYLDLIYTGEGRSGRLRYAI
jgi:hypothetical protein